MPSSSPRYTKILCIICALRCQRLAALWLGSVFSGLAFFIIDLVKSRIPHLDPSTSAWTGYLLSFLDIPGIGPYAESTGWFWYSNSQSRFLATFEDSGIRVQIHRNCPKSVSVFSLVLVSTNGPATNNEGFNSIDIPISTEQKVAVAGFMFPSKPLPEQKASIMASCEVFGWVMCNHEGLPLESIYLDKWLQDEDRSETFEPADGFDTDENDHCNNSVVYDKQIERSIQEWLIGTE